MCKIQSHIHIYIYKQMCIYIYMYMYNIIIQTYIDDNHLIKHTKYQWQHMACMWQWMWAPDLELIESASLHVWSRLVMFACSTTKPSACFETSSSHSQVGLRWRSLWWQWASAWPAQPRQCTSPRAGANIGDLTPEVQPVLEVPLLGLGRVPWVHDARNGLSHWSADRSPRSLEWWWPSGSVAQGSHWTEHRFQCWSGSRLWAQCPEFGLLGTMRATPGCDIFARHYHWNSCRMWIPQIFNQQRNCSLWTWTKISIDFSTRTFKVAMSPCSLSQLF